MAEPSQNPQDPEIDPQSYGVGAAPGTGPKAPEAGGQTIGSEDGLPLEEFARRAGLPEAEVWKRLRRGELVGRTERGRLFVFDAEATAEAAQATFAAWVERETGAELPPLPHPSATAGAGSGAFLALSGDRTASPELALLLDHLSLAKEENREILRLTQDSIKKVSELTDRIVEMKDQVIEAKEAQVMALMQQLEAKSAELRRLAQQNEDLEMLARTMAEKV